MKQKFCLKSHVNNYQQLRSCCIPVPNALSRTPLINTSIDNDPIKFCRQTKKVFITKKKNSIYSTRKFTMGLNFGANKSFLFSTKKYSTHKLIFLPMHLKKILLYFVNSYLMLAIS